MPVFCCLLRREGKVVSRLVRKMASLPGRGALRDFAYEAAIRLVHMIASLRD